MDIASQEDVLDVAWKVAGESKKDLWNFFGVFGGPKGTCQKLLSEIFPLRVFGQDDFPIRGEGGTPQFR